MNQPRVAEIDPHPIRRGERVGARRADLVGGCLVLRHPCERIVVAPMAEVEKAAHGHQKIESGVESFAEPRRQQRLFVRPCALFLHRGNQRQPVSEIVIAQPARAILHIGLQVEDGVPEFVVAAVGQVRQALDDGSRLARHQLGNQLIVQTIEQTAVAGEIAAIEQRNRKFHVVRIEFLAFGQSPRSRAEFEPQVPDLLRKTGDAAL